MGGAKSKTKKVVESEKIDLNHPKLKDVIYKRRDGIQSMETNFSLHNKTDYQNWINNLNRDPGLGSRDVLTPTNHNFKESKMCGSGGKANVTYDNFPYLLSEEIKNRRQYENRKFEEHQLWYLLHTMGNVGSLYHGNGQKVGDISPDNTFMNEDGQVKLASKNSWPGQKTNYQRAFYEKQPAYLSPEELKDLYIGRSAPENDFQRAQSFSAGLTALDAALLDDSSKLYDRKFNFDFDLLNGKRQNLENQPYYSDLLKGTILNLTESNPNKRMTLTELKKWLQPYAANLQEFKPAYIPPQLQETLGQTARQENYPIQSQNQYLNQPENRGTFLESSQRNSYQNSMPTYGESQQRQTITSRDSTNPLQVLRNATMPVAATQMISSSPQVHQQYRSSMPPNKENPQFILPNEQHKYQSAYKQKPIQENRFQHRPTMMEKIKQAPKNIANKFSHSPSHIHKQRIHSLSPPQRESNYLPRSVPEGRFIEGGQPSSQAPITQRGYQPLNPPMNIPSSTIRTFHSPAARPSSSYGTNQNFFHSPLNAGPQKVSFNSNPQITTTTIPGGSYSNYQKSQVIPGGFRVESGSIETRKFEISGELNPTNSEKTQFPSTVQRGSTYNPQKISSYTGNTGKTSLEDIEAKIRNSRMNFPTE